MKKRIFSFLIIIVILAGCVSPVFASTMSDVGVSVVKNTVDAVESTLDGIVYGTDTAMSWLIKLTRFTLLGSKMEPAFEKAAEELGYGDDLFGFAYRLWQGYFSGHSKVAFGLDMLREGFRMGSDGVLYISGELKNLLTDFTQWVWDGPVYKLIDYSPTIGVGLKYVMDGLAVGFVPFVGNTVLFTSSGGTLGTFNITMPFYYTVMDDSTVPNDWKYDGYAWRCNAQNVTLPNNAGVVMFIYDNKLYRRGYNTGSNYGNLALIDREGLNSNGIKEDKLPTIHTGLWWYSTSYATSPLPLFGGLGDDGKQGWLAAVPTVSRIPTWGPLVSSPEEDKLGVPDWLFNIPGEVAIDINEPIDFTSPVPGNVNPFEYVDKVVDVYDNNDYDPDSGDWTTDNPITINIYDDNGDKVGDGTLRPAQDAYPPGDTAPAEPDIAEGVLDDTAEGDGLADFRLDIQFRDLFPFCIPFDVYDLLDKFTAEPEAPNFEFPIKSEIGGIDETIEFDLSAFDSVAAVLRKLELVAFAIGLAFVTRQLIS